ncbi:unnamed protein product [Rotaria sordida]|uniref:Large ribosomal subunit protein uL13 n=1 Tax=Rotaria sordida TaxID=392033 RepID=A0A814ZW13_9BILA|nr:unnamed protein product [Rotaria sordida]
MPKTALARKKALQPVGFRTQPIIIDGRGHLIGRLAATVAKTILQGHNVVIVRCESLNISGSFYRNKLKYLEFLRKRCNINPSRGPFHFRAPSKIFTRIVRGMVPHKTERGKQALVRLRAFEGIPTPYDKKKRMVVPSALRTLRLKPRRRFTELGRLSSEVGWQYQTVVATLEKKRKIKAKHYYLRQRNLKKLKTDATKNLASKPQVAKHLAVLQHAQDQIIIQRLKQCTAQVYVENAPLTKISSTSIKHDNIDITNNDNNNNHRDLDTLI